MEPKSPAVPSERKETLRRQVMTLLREGQLSAKDISIDIGIREKDVYQHLEHIQQTLRQEKCQLVIEPAICKLCGFVFKKRTRLTKPGKCPLCKGSSIEEPRFSLF